MSLEELRALASICRGKESVREIIKVICKEEPNLAHRLHSAVGELMDEGFHGVSVGVIHMAFQNAMFPLPKMNQKEREERHMDEAAGM